MLVNEAADMLANEAAYMLASGTFPKMLAIARACGRGSFPAVATGRNGKRSLKRVSYNVDVPKARNRLKSER